MTEISETESDATERFHRLTEMPPSAKLVYLVLDKESPLTQSQLRERTLLPGRTVRYALSDLREAEIVRTHIRPEDPRQHLYSLRPVDRPDERRE